MKMLKRTTLILALAAVSAACLPSAHAAPATVASGAVTGMSQGTNSSAISATLALFDFQDWTRDRRQTRASEMPQGAGQLAAAFLAFLGYLAIRRRSSQNR